MCGGLAGFFFEHPAQVVGPGKAAQAGHHVQRVLPVQQQPLGGFHPHPGQIAPRRDAQRGGEGAHQMALGHPQPLAELLHAVQARVVGPDVRDGGLHQRRQGGGGAVGIGQLTQQGKGQLAAHPARQFLLRGKAVQQLGSGGAGLAPGQKRQLVQPGQKLGAGLPGELDAQQVAAALRLQHQRGAAQHQMPGRDALGWQQQRSPGGQGPGRGHTGGAPPAGNKADPQPVAGQGEGRAGLYILHLPGCGHGIPVKQQYPTPQINKMLFYITK